MTPQALDSLSREELVALVLAFSEQVRTLQARIVELEQQLKGPPKTPRNSSLPPSAGQKENRPERGRKVRKGRAGVARALAEHPDDVRAVFATTCKGCGQPVTPADQPELAHAYDHIDLPPLRPIVTRVNLHRGACSCCGARLSAPAPHDMPAGSPFGPGIVALVTYLHARHMVSYARLVEILDGLLGLEISEGAIANMLARSTEPFAAEAARIEAAVRQAPVIACDETSARVMGQTCWQWVFGSPSGVAHRIAVTRSAAVPADFLQGATPEVWVSDRYGAQAGHGQAHQLCLAHLLRDAQYAIDAGDTVFAPGFKRLPEAGARHRGPARGAGRQHARAVPAQPRASSRRAARHRAERAGRAHAPERHGQVPGQAVRVRHSSRRAADQQRLRTQAASIGDLPQSDEWVPFGLGRGPLCGGLLGHRHRRAARPQRSPGHPSLPRRTIRPQATVIMPDKRG